MFVVVLASFVAAIEVEPRLFGVYCGKRFVVAFVVTIGSVVVVVVVVRVLVNVVVVGALVVTLVVVGVWWLVSKKNK